ncbi:MAG: hypothetical protein GF315_01070 [candidate division Zixibacteria bacterium]|nr:hypothetical protein [candidate division Zixibacteria bacterium]
MRDILDRIKNGEVLLADGAMGTMLIEKGLKIGDCPERLNLDKPELLGEIARQYFDAGADIIQTNTFGGSPLKLAQYSLESETEELNIAAVNAVRQVVGNNAYIYGSCGPSGRLLKPYGDTEHQEVLDSFKRQITALISEGADLICVETMTDLEEARLAIKAAKSIDSSIPVSATMTFDVTPRGFFTIMGVDIQHAVKGLIEAGADMIGSNCGNGIENMVKIAEEFRRLTSIPLVIQSNAGLPEMIDGRIEYSESPEFMAERCKQLIDIDVNVIGGCCGTTPEHISAFRNVIDKHNSKNS